MPNAEDECKVPSPDGCDLAGQLPVLNPVGLISGRTQAFFAIFLII